MKKPVILVDMDGVVANFVHAVVVGLKDHGVDIDESKIDQFRYLDWACKHIDWAKEVAAHEGFFLNLEPLPGAIEGVRKLQQKYNVRFCTAPLLVNKTCEAEKRAWLEKHFDAQLASDAFIGSDKTVCAGDILIDDNPEVIGANNPSWQHVVFDQTWNKESLSPRMNGWSDIAVIDSVLTSQGATV